MVKKFPTKSATRAHGEKHRRSPWSSLVFREPRVTVPAHEQDKCSAVLRGSTWRLLLAAPGFQQESAHNNHD